MSAKNTSGHAMYSPMVDTTSILWRIFRSGLHFWQVDFLNCGSFSLTLRQNRRLATIDVPPDKLNLAEKSACQTQVKRRAMSQQPTERPEPEKSSGDSMPQWAQMLMVMMGGAVVGNRSKRSPEQSPPHQRLYPSSPIATSTPKRSPFENSDVDYPALKPWLASLDENPSRNKHNEEFSQYAPVLVDTLKLFTLEDVVSLPAKELAEVADIGYGTATRILRFAREDIAMLEHRKKRRVHD
jgi:hypothetical protein